MWKSCDSGEKKTTWSFSNNGFVKDPESEIIYILIFINAFVAQEVMQKEEIIHNWKKIKINMQKKKKLI